MTTQALDFEIDRLEHRSLLMRWTIGAYAAQMWASLILNDPIDELLDAAYFLLRDDARPHHVFVWMGPGGYVLTATGRGADVEVVLGETDSLTPPALPPRIGELARCVVRRKVFVSAVLRAVERWPERGHATNYSRKVEDVREARRELADRK